MNPRHTFARTARYPSHFARHRPLDAIEWEELPSLTGSLRRTDFTTTAGSVWSSTERMELAPSAPEPMPAPFVEAVSGLLVREIVGDEVFRHFFGDPHANH